MANYVCGPMTSVPDYLVATIKVPTDVTLYPGNVVLCAELADDTGNYSVYSPTQASTPTLDEQYAIVINGGWEQLSDGRRPEGQPDYTQYSFSEDEVVTVVFLTPQMRFQISNDAVDGTPDATTNKYLYVKEGQYKLDVGSSVPAGTFSSLKVLATKYFRLGGQFGGQFANTVVAVVQNPTPAA